MRNELNTSGEIVQYTGTTNFIANTNAVIIELFSQGVYTCAITNQDGSVYTLEITNSVTNVVETITVYYGNIRNESRNPSEKKIQLNGKDPRNSNTTSIILGIYCFDTNDDLSDLICCGWNIDDTVNYPSNPSIRGINIEMFQEAKFNGFIKKSYRNNLVCVFRPEFIFYYLNGKDEHHFGIDDTLDLEMDVDYINKIYYGAPGTGKSHKVNELLKGKEERTERVTFHPEYDYASFIGGFKPITEVDAESGKEEIKYKFVPQTFTNIYVDAWNNKDNEYYLVIEEINRGNCAEIFGDIFQLLDRNSDYSITPSNELKQYLVKELTSVDGTKGIENGKMKLPSNLNILATMNTSDQSLFPMDSAFKRRWDWEYIPINYEKSEENPSSNYQVVVSDSISFSWLQFIEKVNTIIKENPNLGMDKCIGNYFIKAKDNIITLEEFINKAIFYLWNDVFKDEDDHIFEENTFYEDFFPISTKGKEKVLKILEKIGLNTPEKED